MKTSMKRFSILFFACLLPVLHIFSQTNALEFVENKGQWEKPVLYKGELTNGAFFLRSTGFSVVQHNAADLEEIANQLHGHEQTKENTPVFEGMVKPFNKTAMPGVLRSHAYEMNFLNANASPKIQGDKSQSGYNNYFLGDDPTKWAGDCKLFQAVTYQDVYPGIDVRYYSESGSLKYEFIVKPGADPSKILMQFTGLEKLSVKKNQLILTTSVGDVKELSPFTYQYVGTERKVIGCRYVLKGDQVRFSLDSYSSSVPLIIDPTLIFASFSGSTADNWGYTATYAPDGSFFAGGVVFATGFPVSPGAFQTKYGAGNNEQSFWNMGIQKFNSDGGQRLYATYVGGSNKDQPHSLFCDPQGNLVIAGRTTSPNYPLMPASSRFGPNGGWDIVVTKLNSTGTALIGSSRIGGAGDDGINTGDSHNPSTSNPPPHLINNYGDDARSEVIMDGANNIYVASCTMSSNFFTTGNAVQSKFGGGQDAVLLKLDPSASNVIYSSYFGGALYDAGFVLSLNPTTQDIYMAGATESTDLPGDKTGAYQPAYRGGRSDGFIAVFSNDGSVLRKTTYMGTPGMDVVFGIQFDKNSFPYIMGVTSGAWPVLNAAFSNPNSKQYISKLKKDLSGFEFSTVFGTGSANPNISPVAFLIDRCENIYVSGWGKDVIGRYNIDPITGMPVTPDALKRVSDGSDFYFIVLARNAASLLYATFYGQNGGFGEHVDGGTSRFDQNGTIYQAICANCGGGQATKPSWPVTPGAWCCSSGKAAASGGGQCNLAALKIAFNFAGVGSGVRAYIGTTMDSTGCVPFNVTFRDTIRTAQSYEWNFGDGSPDLKTTDFTTPHTYNQVGDFLVRLIAIDSASCNIRDTSYVTIKVRADRANIDFNAVKLPPCESLTYRFDNISTAPPGKPFNDQHFIWDFGDRTPRVTAGTGSVNHSFASPGTYLVRLILLDTNYCNAPDSIEKTLRISPLVKAEFSLPGALCAPLNARFSNTSLAGQTFAWDFGDGTSATTFEPVHFYQNPGTYTVKLKVTDPNTCNIVDSTQQTIVIQSKPTSAFTFAPVTPVQNTPITFSNGASSNAIRFKWQFGDEDSLLTGSRSPVDHQYVSSGTFNACLIAITQEGCADTVCAPVEAIVVPKLDVPNAFTPQGPAQTSRIYVRGYAILKMKFSIYNRLGQKVYESGNVEEGWDGKFKGVMQPMDVYGYVLEVEFSDGTRTTKKGDITLIR
jgi:gliding motility-associated-like protein